MFCDQCGRELAAGARFCSQCGHAVSSIGANAPPANPPVYYAPPGPANRVAQHVRVVGILWIICGVLRALEIGWVWMFGRVILPSIAGLVPGWPAHMGLEHLIRGGIFFASGILVLQAVLAFVAGWGLLEYQSWGRIVAIIAAIFALFRIPLGTALGINTLWVLLPASSEAEYRGMIRA